MLKCTQICQWNYSCIGIGCKKPDDELCPIYNVEAKQNPKTNADHIRSMTDDELSELFYEIYNAGAEDGVAYECGQWTNSFEWTIEWLQQPAETPKEG